MKAHLRFYHKVKMGNRYVVELSIHEVGTTNKYPLGIKYGLICKDLKSGAYVLLDNHHPKGPHLHINKREEKYIFVDEDSLIRDFKEIVWKELGVKL